MAVIANTAKRAAIAIPGGVPGGTSFRQPRAHQRVIKEEKMNSEIVMVMSRCP